MQENLNHLFPAARRRLFATNDKSGKPIVLVSLTRDRTAKVDRASFERLMSMGVTPNWSFNHNGTNHSYVRAHVPPRLGFGNTAMISRLILPPAVRRVVVRHRDGDRLNLQLSNLILSERMTGAQAWEATILDFMEAEEKRPIVPQPTALPLDLAGYPLLWL